MRDLSCYLSSISIHTLAAALIIATGISLPPDPGVTRGGVSLSGAQSSVPIDTRLESEETQPLTAEITVSDPFRIAPSEALLSTVEERVELSIQPPAGGVRPAAMNDSAAMTRPLWTRSSQLLQTIGTGSSQSGKSVESTERQLDADGTARQIAAGLRPDSGPGSAPADAPAATGRPGVSEDSGDSITSSASPDQNRKSEQATGDVLPAGTSPKARPENRNRPQSAEAKLSGMTDLRQASGSKATAENAQKSEPAAPARPEPPGAMVEQPPQKLATNPGPVYPREAWEQQQEGVVYLLVQVSGNGQAESVRLYRTSGFQSLDAAAEKTVRRWKFHPAVRGGKPVPSRVVVPIRFRILRK